MHCVIRFVGQGIRLRLHEGDVVELWNEAHELCAEIDAAVILDLLAVQARTARLVRQLMQAPGDPLSRERMRFDPRPGTRLDIDMADAPVPMSDTWTPGVVGPRPPALSSDLRASRRAPMIHNPAFRAQMRERRRARRLGEKGGAG